MNVPTGPFALEYEAEVDLTVHRADPATINETPVAKLPIDILPYLLPSRFVSSDRLTPFAQAEFGALPQGHQRVNAICNWIHDHLAYQPGSSDEQTTADESLLKRAGVCRDFAHLGTAFCRALGIPARFVSCYAHGLVPSDFHAVFEAYLDGRWWLFDATRQADPDGLVRIGVGRDAAEIAFSTPFGNMQPVNQQIRIQRTDGQGSPPSPRTARAAPISPTVDAISTRRSRPPVTRWPAAGGGAAPHRSGPWTLRPLPQASQSLRATQSSPGAPAQAWLWRGRNTAKASRYRPRSCAWAPRSRHSPSPLRTPR